MWEVSRGPEGGRVGGSHFGDLGSRDSKWWTWEALFIEERGGLPLHLPAHVCFR